MLDNAVYYMSGSYSDVYRAFHLEGFLTPSGDKTLSSENAILKDIPRQSFFVSNQTELKELEEGWAKTDPIYYSQGDMSGSAVASTLPMFLMNMEVEPKKNIAQKGLELGYLSRYVRKFSFGYLDKDKNVCGVSVCYLEEPNTKKRFWAISILHNASAKLEKREIDLFTFFPEGWSQHAYVDEERCKVLNPKKIKQFPLPKFSISSFNEQLEKSLNSTQVYLYLEGLIDSTGSIDLDFLSRERGHKFTKSDKREILTLPKKLETRLEEKLKGESATLSPTATPVAPKPNANVTAFIQEPVTANYINQALSPIHYELSEKRTALINKTDNHLIHIRDDGAMQTDPISTSTTPHAAQVILSDFIAMLRTYSVIFREEGAENFPSDKMNLTLAQKPGASETQKTTFIRLEADTIKGLEKEIKMYKESHYPDAFLAKITFNGNSLGVNPKKRPTEETTSDETEEENNPKRLRMGSPSRGE